MIAISSKITFCWIVIQMVIDKLVAFCFERRQAKWCSYGRASLSLVAAFFLGLCFSSQYILFYLKEAATHIELRATTKKDTYNLVRSLS